MLRCSICFIANEWGVGGMRKPSMNASVFTTEQCGGVCNGSLGCMMYAYRTSSGVVYACHMTLCFHPLLRLQSCLGW